LERADGANSEVLAANNRPNRPNRPLWR